MNDYDDVLADPQVRHNRSFTTTTGVTGSEITLVNHPIRYDGETADVALPPQPLGAQTREVLAELGYGPARIDAYVQRRVVVAA